jgi:hypothetical protein
MITKTIFEIKDRKFEMDARIVEVRGEYDNSRDHLRVDLLIDGPMGGGWADGEGGKFPLTIAGYMDAMETIIKGMAYNLEMMKDDPESYEL